MHEVHAVAVPATDASSRLAQAVFAHALALSEVEQDRRAHVAGPAANQHGTMDGGEDGDVLCACRPYRPNSTS